MYCWYSTIGIAVTASWNRWCLQVGFKRKGKKICQYKQHETIYVILSITYIQRFILWSVCAHQLGPVSWNVYKKANKVCLWARKIFMQDHAGTIAAARASFPLRRPRWLWKVIRSPLCESQVLSWHVSAKMAALHPHKNQQRDIFRLCTYSSLYVQGQFFKGSLPVRKINLY